jgi:uncharacterized membrane protein YgcG
VDVTEILDMDFQGEERHGIVRQIPVTLKRKQIPYNISFKLISITDGQDKPLHFRQSQDGAEVELKIGDPDRTISGQQSYKIKYHLNRVINWFTDRPEFYWNATGDQWRFPIEKADALVKLPKAIPLELTNIIAFQGAPGSRNPATCTLADGGIKFDCTNLQPGQGMTIGVSLPIGTMHHPSGMEEVLWWLRDWWQAVTLPLMGLAMMFALWYTGGRDIDGGKAIAVEWNPPKGLNPSEVGTLIDERCDLQDITSTLVDLAARGHLKIKEIKTDTFFFMTNKDYEFEKTDPPSGGEALKPPERLFLCAMFADQAAGSKVMLSSLKGTFYPCLERIRAAIYESLTAQQFFRHNPEQTRMIYVGVAGFIAFLAVCACAFSIPTAIGLGLTAAIVGCFVPVMPSRTAKGSQLTREALGFARFVRKAEKERLRVLAADDPTLFGRLLPYAMVLGAADQWAQAFKDLAIEPPSWYVSSSGYDNYSTPLFVNDLGAGLRSFENTFTTPPASSSGSSDTSSAWSGGSAFDGGGSGGGFGGGGGDSW